MRLSQAHDEPRFPQRTHGRARLFCRPVGARSPRRGIEANTRELPIDADLAPHRVTGQAPAPKVSRGVLARFALLVGSASDGATTQPASPAPRSTTTSNTPNLGVTA